MFQNRESKTNLEKKRSREERHKGGHEGDVDQTHPAGHGGPEQQAGGPEHKGGDPREDRNP